MNIIFQYIKGLVKDYLLGCVIISFICITSTYGAIEVLIITPKEQEIKRQNKIISELTKKIDKLEKYIHDYCQGRFVIQEYERLKQENKELKERLNECCMSELELCSKQGGGTKKIKINDISLTVSINDFWEKGKKVSLRIHSPTQSSSKPIETSPLQAGDTQKVVFHNYTYAITVTYVKEPCIKISIENIKED